MQRQDRADRMLSDWEREIPGMATLELGAVKRVGRLAGLIETATLAALAPFGVTYAEFDVLATLRREPAPHELQPRILAARASLTTGGISNIVNRLVRAGLVERRPNESDGRSALVRLSSTGVSETERMAEATKAAHTAFFSSVPQAQLRQLDDLLRTALLDLGDEA